MSSTVYYTPSTDQDSMPSAVQYDLYHRAFVNWSFHNAKQTDMKTLMKNLHFVPNPNSVRTEHRIGLTKAS